MPSLLNLPASCIQPPHIMGVLPAGKLLYKSPTKLNRGEGALLNDPSLLSFSEWGICFLQTSVGNLAIFARNLERLHSLHGTVARKTAILS